MLIIFFSCKTQKNIEENVQSIKFEEKNNFYRIMFYNVENLFDTEDDPKTNDEEFTPNGVRAWNDSRLRTKLNNIYKVITAVGTWDYPIIVGLSEIENRKCLDMLLERTPLSKQNYRIIHYESPDRRGIDVAMLYRHDLFSPFAKKRIPIIWSKNIGTGTTRDILLVSGVTKTKDTLHVFVNHWPSRWGGQMETEEKRMYLASIIKHHCDSIIKNQFNANIIVMGDLNDYPTDKSLMNTLKAQTKFDNAENDKLYNLSWYLQEIKHLGTHKYDGQWGILDQIIVSGALLNKSNNVYTTTEDTHIFKEAFLLELDDKYPGDKLNRTYVGYKYNGGYSDHLPVYLDLKIGNNKE